MNTVSFTLPMPPSSNRYWRTMVTKKGVVVTYVSDEARKYKARVAVIARMPRPIYSEISIQVKVFRPQRSGDLDNKLKVLFDSLQGVVYANDSQIVEIHALRFEDKNNPRVEVEVKPLGLC